MKPRFVWRSPENKPRWIILLLLGVLAAFGVVATAAYLKTPIAQTANPILSVDVKADRHPISPDIYGMNHYGLDPALAKELQIPLERWGLITPAATTVLSPSLLGRKCVYDLFQPPSRKGVLNY